MLSRRLRLLIEYLSLDADDRAQARDTPRKARAFRRRDNRVHVLVRTRCFFCDATRRGAAYDDPFREQFVADLPPAPQFEGCMAGHRPSGPMAGGREALARIVLHSGKNVGAGPHATADKNRLPGSSDVFG